MQIKIRKGLDVKLQGAAVKPESAGGIEAVMPAVVAVCPDDFQGFVPKVAVKEGQAVSAGDPLMFHKLNPEIKLVSPVSGTVKAVVRGEKRRVLRVEVTPSAEAATESRIAVAPAADFAVRLQNSGLWCMMRQRPYDVIPEAGRPVRDVFVTAFDSSPLAPHLELSVMGAEAAAELEAGVKALGALTQGHVYVCVPSGYPVAPVVGAEWVTVDGPHPSGNVGPQIAAIKPVNKGETVWTLDIVTLRKIGQLALTGSVDATAVVTVAGPEVARPAYVRTVAGADVESLLAGRMEPEQAHRRVISGSVLTGVKVGPEGYLRYPYRQITVIREGDDADEFMGWANPGAGKLSTKRSVLGHFLSRAFAPDARLGGGHRALILSGELDKVLPMDILGEYLLKAILARDVERMEQLGIYEVAPEDFALPEFVDTSKHPLQQMVREGLDFMRKEVE